MMSIDELVSQAAQLPSREQDELVQRLIDMRGLRRTTPSSSSALSKTAQEEGHHLFSQGDDIRSYSTLPPGTPGTVWIERWESVRIEPSVADEMLRAIEESCGRIDPNDWL